LPVAKICSLTAMIPPFRGYVVHLTRLEVQFSRIVFG
jgi:hypothetical protein